MKHFVLCVLAGIVAALLGIQVFDLCLEPNNRFFRRAAQRSDAWEAHLRAISPEPCYIFEGGSEIRMGVDPGLMLREYGVRAVNAGGAAFFGVHVNTRMALQYTRPGDTLVLSLPYPTLSEKDLVTPGLKFAWSRLGPAMFDGKLIPCNSYTVKETLKGSSGMLSMYICKRICTPHQMYKYDVGSRIHESGWCELFYNNMLRGRPWRFPCPPSLSHYSQPNKPMLEYLAALKEICRERQVRLAVYIAPGCVHASIRACAAMEALSLIRLGIPVIRTEPLGAEPDNRLFADMSAHLNGAGAAKHSRLLAQALRDRRFWTEEELVHFLRCRGWGEHGERTGEPVVW